MLIRRAPSLAPSGAFFRWALRTCALLLILGTGTLLAFLLFKGLPTLGARLFFGDVPALDALLGRQAVWDGLWPACAGTACLVGLTVLLAVFPGVGCGLYLAEFAPKRQAARIRLAMDVLAGTPSIVMGLFGFTLILFLRKTFQTEANTSLFLAAACLALLVLPVLVTTTCEALEAVPKSLRTTATALGFTRRQARAPHSASRRCSGHPGRRDSRPGPGRRGHGRHHAYRRRSQCGPARGLMGQV